MKQRFSYLFLCFLLLWGCRDGERNREQDYIETLGKNYKEVIKEFPEARLKAVTCILSGDIREKGDTIRVIDYTEVYELYDSCIANFPDTIQTLKGRTSGGQEDIGLEELEMTLHEAVEILRNSNLILPQTQILAIQKPQGFIHPLYVFGSGHGGWIAVDMGIRKVYKL